MTNLLAFVLSTKKSKFILYSIITYYWQLILNYIFRPLDNKLKRTLDLPTSGPTVPEKVIKTDNARSNICQAGPLGPFTGVVVRDAGKYKIQVNISKYDYVLF